MIHKVLEFSAKDSNKKNLENVWKVFSSILTNKKIVKNQQDSIPRSWNLLLNQMQKSPKVEMNMSEAEDIYSEIQKTALPDESRTSNETKNLNSLHQVLSTMKEIPWQDYDPEPVDTTEREEDENKEEVQVHSVDTPKGIDSSTKREQSIERMVPERRIPDAEIVVNYFGNDGEFIRFSVKDLRNKVITKPMEFIKDFR